MSGSSPPVSGRPSFRQALAQGRTLLGVWSMLNSTIVVEGLSVCDFDWILIDGEHAPVTLPDAISHLRAARGFSIMPIVRLPWNDPILIKQFLDAGACTLMLPYVETPEEAQAAVTAMRYPPRGKRGVAAVHRASLYGTDKSYIAEAEDTLTLIVQIESADALARVEEIAAVDGVDAVFFGPGDLAASMNHLGKPAEPAVIDAILEGRERLRNVPVKCGVLAPTPDLAERFIRERFDFVSVANDANMLFTSATSFAARFRAVEEKSR